MSILTGINILDLATGRAGSLATALLADFGADVVKVVDTDPRTDRPQADPDWIVCNRGKRIATFDPTTGLDTNELQRLVAGSDIVLADDRTALTALGLAPNDRSGLIVLLTPPYDGLDTPWHGGGEAPELLSAVSGMSMFQASHSGGPVDAVTPYLAWLQAGWAATCAVSALVEREETALGQTVEVTALGAAEIFGAFAYARPEDEAPMDRAVGPGGLNPMYTRYCAADGTWFFIGGLGPKFGAAVLELTGSTHLLDDPRVGGNLGRLWHVDNSRRVISYFDELYATEPAQHWIDLFTEGDVPVTILQDRKTWFAMEQLRLNGLRVDLSDPFLGSVAMPGSPVASELTPPDVRPAGKPEALEDVHWIEVRAAEPVAESAAAATRNGPLAGCRIASFGAYVAGPFAGGLLAELGAEVIKVEPLAGDPWRMQGFMYNCGTRSFSVDLQRPEGREALQAILRDCDVVLDNFRLGVTSRLGIDHQQLSARNPSVLTVSVTAYGETGPLAGLPGYDPVLQAASGMMTAQGGGDEPVIHSVPPNDHTAGVLGAFAAVLGLLHRARTGEAQHLSTSLAAAATFLQGPELVEYTDRPLPRAGARDYAGPSPVDRSYPVVGGYIRLQTDAVDVVRWRDAGIDVDEQSLSIDAVHEIGRALGELTVEQAVDALARAHVRVVPVRHPKTVASDSALHDREVFIWNTTLRGQRYPGIHRSASFSRTTRTEYLRPPGLGEHTVDLLDSAGYDPVRIDAMLDAGAVKSGGPIDIQFMPVYR